MKKLFFLPVMMMASAVLITGCFKTNNDPVCTSNTLQADQKVIDSFIKNNGLTIPLDGQANVYTQVLDAGVGSTPVADSFVIFKYEGRLLNGTLFDSLTTKAYVTINQLVNAGSFPYGLFAYALPKLKEGGTLQTIVPSSLAYNCRGALNNLGQQVVPPNAQVIYNIKLIDVKQN